MSGNLKLPVGIDDFRKIRECGFYYVDKTKLVEQLMQNWGEVNLFTRPRRFGKTLNMSMLRSFFEIGTDKSLFDGLYISRNKELCDMHMGKYPVISITLKGIEGMTFEEARNMLKIILKNEARRHYYLKNSDRLTDDDKQQYEQILLGTSENTADSLRLLSQLLFLHYDKKVVILIDEYDVPLDKAFQNGYYSEMTSLIRGILGQALKTNDYLQFAVLTGCLRISKESIFTGLNNFKVLSIADARFDEQFGFTDSEVRDILEEYGVSDKISEVKDWYDGYRFGKAGVYCPWDVINYVDHLQADPNARPQAYWINSSGNGLVRRLINIADESTKDEIERLIAGETIEKAIRLDLTYDEIDNSIDNIWSVLFTTGYLTNAGEIELPGGDGYGYRLVIPNKEVRQVFVSQIQEWFRQTVTYDNGSVQDLCGAFMDGDTDKIQNNLNMILIKTISVLDTKARDEQKENFYHGLLLGLLRNNPDWRIKSNRESGDGFSDISIEPTIPEKGIVVEVKYSNTISGLDDACDRAMKQIRDRRYDEALREDGREDIIAYGIAFCRKRCKVVCEKM
ncbi:AAA family ATPase [Coprococcus eutactus]|uniref:AAA family ATPase n=1 Tax=Coprococcus eutactus TaxID=33043 RepID=UPI001C023548|nr:AAA family ATPase [Coprococcus eutactus]MBT9730765.1 AAA family ATPase [Coprococcus eutactus]